MKMKVQLFLMVFGLLLAACGNDPALNGVKMELKAVSAQSTINARVGATGLNFSQIMVGVQDMEFETDMEDDAEDLSGGESESEEVEFEGPYSVDLIAGTSSPSFGLADVQTGLYDKIEIKMGPVLEGGKTIVMSFSSDGVQYEFSTTEEIELEVESDAGYQLSANAFDRLLVIFNLDALFANIDLSGAVADGDGVVRINNDSNSEIHNQILDALDSSCEGGEDNDHDDEIDD